MTRQTQDENPCLRLPLEGGRVGVGGGVVGRTDAITITKGTPDAKQLRPGRTPHRVGVGVSFGSVHFCK